MPAVPTQTDSNVVRLDRANERLRDGFLHWQCRVRQIAMRKHEGRPTSGMTPSVFPVPAPVSEPTPGSGFAPRSGPAPGSGFASRSGSAPGSGFASRSGPAPEPVHDASPIARIVTILCKRPEHSATMELRHMARRTHDPAERREAALKFLAERYYQTAREFSDTLTAGFPPDSRTAAKLLDLRECRLVFEQFRQRYDLPCTVRRLSPNNPLREATFWHNLLFNPRLSANCTILGFEPDWPRSNAEPPRPGDPGE